MINFIASAILSGAVVLGGGGGAMQKLVERSGNVYHVAVCARTNPAGTARCHAHIVTDAQGNPLTNTRSPATLPSGFSPANLRSAYKITATGSPTTTVAIVDAYGYTNAEADLAVYRSTFGLPPCTTANGCFRKVTQTGMQSRYPADDNGWSQESALDLDMVSAMCPNCKIILVEATNSSFTNLATAANEAALLGANVISNSYGGGEVGSQSFDAAYTHAGVAVTASTGDDSFAAGPQFPATSPHVIAVGGTSLFQAANARGWTESAWAGAGSGCSTVYPKPAWQHDIQCTKRMEADVSAIADPQTGVAVYCPNSGRSISQTRSTWLVFGGTSVAAPLIGGVYGANGGASLVMYGSNPYNNLSGLFDVTTGSNGVCNSYFCNSGVGYDGPTGLGTPNGISAF